MRKCPWCGRENLSVYAYCQSCGRGFEELEQPNPRKRFNLGNFWPFGKKAA